MLKLSKRGRETLTGCGILLALAGSAGGGAEGDEPATQAPRAITTSGGPVLGLGPADAPRHPQAPSLAAPTLSLGDGPPDPYRGELLLGQDALGFHEIGALLRQQTAPYSPRQSSPLAGVPDSDGETGLLGLARYFDASDATLQAVATNYYRVLNPAATGLQPYFLVARQSNEYDETIRVGAGAGVRYPFSPTFGVAADLVTFGAAGNTTTHYARQSETVFMVRMEWRY